jgi:V/A-type H+/Na+-transporting ATPase subunit I
MFLKGQYKWIHGEKLAAFFQDFSSIILIATGLMLYFAPAELKQLAQTIFIASLILFVWGQGHGSTLLLRPLMGLLGTINFCISLLGNSLSYLRILALGLVTGAIAMAINQVAIEVGKLFPLVLAIPAIVLIFSLGHLVSIALNTLGSFVHSGRLQFIEFFSQFFEGGGRAFSPFRRSVS